MSTQTEKEKLDALTAYFKELGDCIIAFSGGVDSTFMAKAAHDALGDKMLAVTVVSPSFPRREMLEAIEFCQKEGIPHEMVEYDELSIPGFKDNPKNRCYLCKKNLFGMLWKWQETKDSTMWRKAPTWMTTEITVPDLWP